MNRRLLQFMMASIIGLMAVTTLAQPALAQTGTNSPPTGAPPTSDLDFNPEIPLPGVFEGQQRADNNLLAHYIRAIYIYFVWVVGVVAVVMVVYGGIRWVAAAGNPGQIKEAREIIDGAIIGVLIALSSIVLLNIINPRLTRLNVPGLSYVKAGTPLYSNFNAEWGCYEDITCPADFTQVLGGSCGNGGVNTHVNPGELSCAPATKKGICCQGTTEGTKTTCVGFSAANLKQDYNGTCFAVADVPIPDVKCNDLPCGQIAADRRCQGVQCSPNFACYLHDKTGECVPPDKYFTFTKTNSNQECAGAKAWYTSAAVCGQLTITLDDNGKSVNGIGTGSCPSGKYCSVNPPVKLNGACTIVQGTTCLPIQ